MQCTDILSLKTKTNVERIWVGDFRAINLKLILIQTTEELNKKSGLMWCILNIQMSICLHRFMN